MTICRAEPGRVLYRTAWSAFKLSSEPKPFLQAVRHYWHKGSIRSTRLKQALEAGGLDAYIREIHKRRTNPDD